MLVGLVYNARLHPKPESIGSFFLRVKILELVVEGSRGKLPALEASTYFDKAIQTELFLRLL
jgi:hypothetical protein